MCPRTMTDKMQPLPGDRSADVPLRYPLGTCIARFFMRLILGAVVWIVMLVILVGSALPYGNSDRTGGILFVIATLVILLWALAGFIPPGKFKFEIEDE